MAWEATLLAAVYNNDGCDFVVEAVDLEGKRKPLKIVGHRDRLTDDDLKALVREATSKADAIIAGKNGLTIRAGEKIDLTPPVPPDPTAEDQARNKFLSDRRIASNLQAQADSRVIAQDDPALLAAYDALKASSKPEYWA